MLSTYMIEFLLHETDAAVFLTLYIYQYSRLQIFVASQANSNYGYSYLVYVYHIRFILDFQIYNAILSYINDEQVLSCSFIAEALFITRLCLYETVHRHGDNDLTQPLHTLGKNRQSLVLYRSDLKNNFSVVMLSVHRFPAHSVHP